MLRLVVLTTRQNVGHCYSALMRASSTVAVLMVDGNAAQSSAGPTDARAVSAAKAFGLDEHDAAADHVGARSMTPKTHEADPPTV